MRFKGWARGKIKARVILKSSGLRGWLEQKRWQVKNWTNGSNWKFTYSCAICLFFMEIVRNGTLHCMVKHERGDVLVIGQQAAHYSSSGEGVQHEGTWRSLLKCYPPQLCCVSWWISGMSMFHSLTPFSKVMSWAALTPKILMHLG